MDINTFIKELERLNIYPTQKQLDQLANTAIESELNNFSITIN